MLFIYIIYKNIFRNHINLKNHIKHDHQSMIKIKFQIDDMTKVKRIKDNIFKCKYEKRFKLPNSLRRYAKECNDELTEPKERALMDVLEDFNVSESMNMNDRIILTDCFGALISYEKC